MNLRPQWDQGDVRRETRATNSHKRHNTPTTTTTNNDEMMTKNMSTSVAVDDGEMAIYALDANWLQIDFRFSDSILVEVIWSIATTSRQVDRWSINFFQLSTVFIFHLQCDFFCSFSTLISIRDKWWWLGGMKTGATLENIKKPLNFSANISVVDYNLLLSHCSEKMLLLLVNFRFKVAIRSCAIREIWVIQL